VEKEVKKKAKKGERRESLVGLENKYTMANSKGGRVAVRDSRFKRSERSRSEFEFPIHINGNPG